ncbi:alpha/beta fold hydrolase [Actinoplanes sp. NPDC051494]|uniref:alpha/beta fold hydrolase n=1 Tax=Actinoplanes sp. NPDC051494 TaxID=3363907 RepID=UPI0037B2C4E1
MPSYAGADGTQLHYDELGDGPVLIALAGGAGRHPSYLGDLAGLDSRHRLVVPHLRGVGLSPMPDATETASYWRQAEDVEALRLHLGLGRVHLLGHSAGTRLAMAYAVRFPDRLSALVLVTPPAAHLVDVPSDAEELFAAKTGEPWFDSVVEAGRAGPETPDDAGINAFFQVVMPRGFATWNETARVHGEVGPVSWAANQAFQTLDPPGDLAALLAGVPAPVLVIAGAQDFLTGFAPVAALPALFPHGSLAVLADCGHYPWVEQPAAFRAALDGFLERA